MTNYYKIWLKQNLEYLNLRTKLNHYNLSQTPFRLLLLLLLDHFNYSHYK